MPTFLAALMIAAAPLSAFAGGIVQPTLTGPELQGVKLSTSAEVTVGKDKFALTQIAAGLRRKKVAVFWAKVYVAQIFASETKKIAPGTKVAAVHEELSTKNAMVAIAMTLKRDLSSNQIKDGFVDSLKHNDIDPASSGMKPVMDAIARLPEQPEDKTIWLILRRLPDGTETVYFQDAAEAVHTVTVEKGVLKNLLLIWFGKSADSGMEQLQEQLIPQPQKSEDR